jgi:diguanylate cyclase (GGDEF)-like protein/PAS domain S-box-containing protein
VALTPAPAARRIRAHAAGAARLLAAGAKDLTARAKHRPPVVAFLPGLATGTAAVLLVLGLTGAMPVAGAAALAVAVSTAAHASRLIQLALSIHVRQHRFGPCRGAGFLGMGVLVGGVTVVGLAGVAPASPPVRVGGLLATTTMYLLGLLLLPGAAVTVAIRLRRLLDGAAVGTALFYTAWLVLIPVDGIRTGLALTAGLVACAAMAVALVTGLRAVRYRPAAVACSGGAALAVAGLAGLVVTPPPAHSGAFWWLAAVAVVSGPALTAAGARRTGTTDPDPAAADGSFAGYPLLALPVGAALVATVYRLITTGPLDRTSIAIAAVAVTAVAGREALAALDVRRYAFRLASREAHFRSLVAGSSDVTAMLDSDLVVRWLSPAAARQFALSEQDVVGRPFTALVHPEDVACVVEWLTSAGNSSNGHPALVEARLRDGYGRWRETESTVSDQRATPEVTALVVHIRDIGDRRDVERALRQLAVTDELTGLPNRRELHRAVAVGQAMPEPSGHVLVLDLDGLAGVGDVRGHELTDAVLIDVARRLRAGVDPADLPARVAGDQFAVLTPLGAVRSFALATRLVTVLTEPYRLPGATVHLSATAGLAPLAGTGSVDDVLRRADLALVRAKRAGRSRVEWYDESMEAALLRNTALEQGLPGVVERGELDLVYQPVIELANQHPVGAEALLRWRHPKLGTVSPTELIPIAEDLGLADGIGAWVLHRACRQLSSWRREGWDLWLSVNVSPRQLLSPGFVPGLRDALDTHLITPESLLLEVSERGFGAAQLDVDGDDGLAAALARVHALGVRTAIDHFGTGPTSLAHLRRMAVDVLKVDRSLFAEPAGQSGPAAPIMDVVMGLADRLGLQVIASGLEAESHLDAVRTAGCRFGQGHLFAMPTPAEHLEAYLTDHRSPSF